MCTFWAIYENFLGDHVNPPWDLNTSHWTVLILCMKVRGEVVHRCHHAVAVSMETTNEIETAILTASQFLCSLYISF
jgi:hypothetical protein